MAIGDPMTSTIPVVGTAGTGYATQIDAFLEEVKDRLETQIPLSALLVSPLDMLNNPIENAEYVSFYSALNSPTTPVGSIQYYLGDFWMVTAAGAVKITSAGTLNAASVGGITGDYGGVNPAQWRFVDADQTFYGYDDYGLGQWAHVQARDFQIVGGLTGSPRLRLSWGGAANYTLTFPAAVPASTLLMQMSAAGAVTASNTAASAITAPDYRWTTTRTRAIAAERARPDNSNNPCWGYTSTFSPGSLVPLLSSYWQGLGSGVTGGGMLIELDLENGERLRQWNIHIDKTSNATKSVYVALYRRTPTTSFSAVTLVGTPQVVSTNNPGELTLTDSMTETVNTGVSYFIAVYETLTATGGPLQASTGIKLFGGNYVVDRA